MLHSQNDLDDTCNAGGGFSMAEVRFRTTQQHGVGSITLASQNATDSRRFNGIPQDGAGTVRFNVVHCPRVDGGVTIGALQNINLGLRIRCGNTIGTAIRVHGRAFNHTQDAVPVATGIGQALEDDNAGAVGTDNAIGIGGESMNLTGGREYSQLTEGDSAHGIGKNVHATSDGGISLPVA